MKSARRIGSSFPRLGHAIEVDYHDFRKNFEGGFHAQMISYIVATTIWPMGSLTISIRRSSIRIPKWQGLEAWLLPSLSCFLPQITSRRLPYCRSAVTQHY